MNWVRGIAAVFHTALGLWNLLDLCLGNLLRPAEHGHRCSSESHWNTGVCLASRLRAGGLVVQIDELQLLSFKHCLDRRCLSHHDWHFELSILFKCCSFGTANSSGCGSSLCPIAAASLPSRLSLPAVGSALSRSGGFFDQLRVWSVPQWSPFSFHFIVCLLACIPHGTP